MPRLGVRRRLALVFAVGSTLGIALGAGLLFVVLNRQWSSAIDDGLRARADDLTAEVRLRDGAIENTDPFAQVLASDGTVVAWSPGDQAVEPVVDVRAARPEGIDVFVEKDVTALGGPSRLLVRRVDAPGRTFVLVVADALDATRRAQERLAAWTVLAGIVLAFASAGAGWWVAGAALRPVRDLTDEVDTITSLNQLGQRLRVPGGSDDVTRLGHTLNAALARIDEAVRHERAFIDDASHELRTPIAIIQGELELAQTAVDDPVEMRRVLDSALDETARLRRLADTLLMLARLDGGQLVAHSAAFDLLETATLGVNTLAPHGDVAIDVRGTPTMAWGDHELTERIVSNLLVNAQRFARQRVIVSVEDEADWAVLTVLDDGPGFPPDLLPVAFERFSQHGGHAGTGLGLAIAASLAAAQHGSIAAANDPAGSGACVRVTLPREAPGARRGYAPPARSSRRSGSVRLPTNGARPSSSGAGEPTVAPPPAQDVSADHAE